jgi:rhodanese-related sulfurtransferase
MTAPTLSRGEFSLEVPPAIGQITPEELAPGIAAPGDAEVTVIVDVRQADEFAKGNIVSSRNHPIEHFDADAFATEVKALFDGEAGRKVQVVFVSLQSPDIDLVAALNFAQKWDELGYEAATGVAGAALAHTLLGGVCYWLQENRADAALTKDYDAAVWDATLGALR